MACANTPQSQLTKTKNAFGLGKKLRRKASPTFYKNSPQKHTSQPAKVHTSARLATRPRLASPVLACDHTKRSAHLPAKPTTAQPAPQALPTANPPKPRLASKHHGRKKPRPPFSTANKAPRPASATRPNGSTAPPQLPQPQERPLTPHRASAANQPPLNFQSSSLFRLRRRPTRLRRFNQRFHQPKIIRPHHFCFLFSPSARFLPPPFAQRLRQRHGVAVLPPRQATPLCPTNHHGEPTAKPCPLHARLGDGTTN